MSYKAIILLIFLFSIKVQSQIDEISEYKFTYLLTYQPDTTDAKIKKTEKMILLVGKDISLFESYNKHLKDSMLLDIANDSKKNLSLPNLASFPRTQFNYKIFKDYASDNITVYDRIFTDEYKYEETKQSMLWKIENNTTIINGYKCQEAITSFSGRKYQAWFTTDIPISDGPYKFSGLPGLIVKISDLKQNYVFELIDQSKTQIKISNSFIEKEPYKTDKKTFFIKLNEFKNNSIQRIQDSGFTFDERDKESAKKRIKSKNNPIELIQL